MTDDLRHQHLKLAMTELDRQYGKGTVIRLGDEDIAPWPAISTGALTLDLALGIGGLPRGRIVEIYGPEGAGKSTLALSVVAEAQKVGITALYVDAEQAIDPIYAKKLGIDMDELFFTQPGSLEEGFTTMQKMIKTTEIGLVVVDSVAALVPEEELEKGMDAQQMGLHARLMGKGIRSINGILTQGDNKTMVIFINQLRTNLGVMFGNPETTPGGRALKYYSTVRIDLRKKSDTDGGTLKNSKGEVTGLGVRAKVVKNKVGPPLRVSEFDILYGVGVDKYGCIVDLAAEKGLINKSGAWYKDLNGDVLAQGRDSMITYLKNDLAFADKLEAEIKNG